MKKFLLVLMAIGLTFAMISCGGDDPPPVQPETTITITFNKNYDVGAAGALTFTRTITSGAAIGDLPTITDVPRSGYALVGWWDNTGFTGDAVVSTDTFDADTELYARWTMIPASDTEIIVTFNFNYAAAAGEKQVRVNAGSSVGTTDWAATPTRIGYNLVGWYDSTALDASGNPTGAAFTASSNITLAAATEQYLTLYAIWKVDMTNAEMVYLENAGNVVYKFTLPANTTFGDFTHITVMYLITQEEMDAGKGNAIRATRLFGNYKESDFTTDFNGAQIAKYGSGTNSATNKFACYLYDDLGVSWTSDWSRFSAVGGEWFTVTYRLVGNSPNSDFQADNKPAIDATGPFYFGVGIPAGGDSKDGRDLKNGTVQYIRNVTMVGFKDLADPTNSVADVIGTIPELTGTSGVESKQVFGSYEDPVCFAYRSAGAAINTATLATNMTTALIPSPPPPLALPSTPKLTYPTDNNDQDLSTFTWLNNANQKGWYGDGTAYKEDGVEKIADFGLGIDQLVWGKAIEITFGTSIPMGGTQIYWQGDSRPDTRPAWDVNETLTLGQLWNSVAILPNSGLEAEDGELKGDLPSGVTWDPITKVLRISLSIVLPYYDYFELCQEDLKIGLQYYGPSNANWTAVDIASVKLTIYGATEEKETDVDPDAIFEDIDVEAGWVPELVRVGNTDGEHGTNSVVISGAAKNVATVAMDDSGGGYGFTIQLPTYFEDYDNVVIEYTCVTTSANPAKVTLKRGFDNFNDNVTSAWINLETGDGKSISRATSGVAIASKKPGITFQINNYVGGSDVEAEILPMNFVVTITKVKLADD